MMRIDFDEEKHEYSVDGVRVPSVSEILAPLSAERYGELNKSVLEQAAHRGTAVHEGTQLIDFGIAPDYDSEIDGYLVAYQMFLLQHEVEWGFIEGTLGYIRAEEEIPLYAGTIDRFGLVDGMPTVVDIKTYSSMSSQAQLQASCQTALYADALESNGFFVMNRAVLHLRKDGTYRLINLGKWDTEHGFNSRDTAWMLWNIWNNKDKALKTVRKGISKI